MKVVSRRALLTGIVLGLGLPVMGCGGEPLKPTPEGAAPAGPPPTSEAEYHKRDLDLLKAKPATKTGKPAR
jgi:hypothetical protein